MHLSSLGFDISALWLALPALFLIFCAHDILIVRKASSRLPFPLIGTTSRFTPAFVLNWRFATNAASLLEQGYNKYKDVPFQVLVNGEPTVILPPPLLSELASLSPSTASTAASLEHDFMGAWTGHFQMLLESRLHFNMVQRRLTPRLGQLMPGLRQELALALEEFLPVGEDWKKINAHHLMTRLALRLSGHVLIGPELCRDPRWTKLVVKWTENSGITFAILRFLPAFLRPVVVRLLPSHWISVYYARQAQRLLEPRLAELLRATEEEKKSTPGLDVEKADEAPARDDGALSWLAGAARGRHRTPAALTQIVLILAFASVHSVMVRLVNTLFDVVDHPDLVAELRAEAAEAEAAKATATAVTVGGGGIIGGGGYTPLLQPKLDSAMRESQRLHPVLMVGMKRVFRRHYAFRDGTRLPAGTHVCMPTLAAATDPAVFADPWRFDGLRCYRRRLEQQRQKQQRHERERRLLLEGDAGGSAADDQGLSLPSLPPAPQPPAAASVVDDKLAFAYAGDRFEMGFGYGRMACPGRFFAGMTIQMVLTRLLVDYDIEYLPGKGRPRDVQMHDFFVPWPLGKVRMRRRKMDTVDGA